MAAQGVEEAYEEVLRGVKGVKYILKDKHNKEIGSYKEGKFDTIAKQGKRFNFIHRWRTSKIRRRINGK